MQQRAHLSESESYCSFHIIGGSEHLHYLDMHLYHDLCMVHIVILHLSNSAADTSFRLMLVHPHFELTRAIHVCCYGTTTHWAISRQIYLTRLMYEWIMWNDGELLLMICDRLSYVCKSEVRCTGRSRLPWSPYIVRQSTYKSVCSPIPFFSSCKGRTLHSSTVW